MLVSKSNDVTKLVPIDHGLSLPDWRQLLEATFDWFDWKQAKESFSKEFIEYVCLLDEEVDALVFRRLGLRRESIFTLIICTRFLKQCVERGLSLYEIGSMMVRDLFDPEPSALEKILYECLPEEERDSFDCGADLSSHPMVSFFDEFRNLVSRAIDKRSNFSDCSGP